MKKRIIKVCCVMMALCALLVCQMTTVLAAEGTASITIQGNEGQSLKGKTWKVHKLFYAENADDGESIRYTLNDVYKTSLQEVVAPRVNKEAKDVTEYDILDCMQKMNHHIVEGAATAQGLELSTSDYRYFMEELMQEIRDNHIQGDSFSVNEEPENNRVVMSGLEYGYYILEDVSDVNGSHTAASLAIVTTANPTASMNIKSDYPTITKKIYEEDHDVEWNDIADYEIGETVPFKYTSTVPNMDGYESYYYAWHDVMDEALTLQEDSIEIQISDSNSTYTLESGEYTVDLSPDGTDTFLIQIADIKKIIDQKFPQISNGEVTVYYEAVLNENAQNDTGRPGFENDVRLEYSNNPNLVNGVQAADTGFTPWDTTVCFTYRLDGLKVNDKDAFLANAKFKIYKDEACTEEVFSEEYISDSKGEFVIYGLDSDTYYLKEVQAPAGYRPIDEPIKVEVTATFPENRDDYKKGDGAGEEMFLLEGVATITTFEEGEEKTVEAELDTDAEQGALVLKITNRIGNKLPITGSYMMPVLFAIGGVCVYLGARTGKQKDE